MSLYVPASQCMWALILVAKHSKSHHALGARETHNSSVNGIEIYTKICYRIFMPEQLSFGAPPPEARGSDDRLPCCYDYEPEPLSTSKLAAVRRPPGQERQSESKDNTVDTPGVGARVNTKESRERGLKLVRDENPWLCKSGETGNKVG